MPYCVVVLGGRQPTCVLRLVWRGFCSLLGKIFLSEISISMRGFFAKTVEKTSIFRLKRLHRVMQDVRDRVGEHAVGVGVKGLQRLRRRAELGLPGGIDVQIEDEARLRLLHDLSADRAADLARPGVQLQAAARVEAALGSEGTLYVPDDEEREDLTKFYMAASATTMTAEEAAEVGNGDL